MLDITTPPPPVLMLLLTNLLGYKGPTIVKPILCLELSQWTRALGGSRQELNCLVEVPPPLPSLYKNPESSVTSGEAGWTAGSMHLHHALGTSQVWAHTLIHTLAERSSLRQFGVRAYSGHGQGHVPLVQVYLGILLVIFSLSS